MDHFHLQVNYYASLGVTPEMIANHLGVSRLSVWQWMAGHIRPPRGVDNYFLARIEELL